MRGNEATSFHTQTPTGTDKEQAQLPAAGFRRATRTVVEPFADNPRVAALAPLFEGSKRDFALGGPDSGAHDSAVPHF